MKLTGSFERIVLFISTCPIHHSYIFFSHNSINRRKKVEFFSFAMILELVNPKPDSVFVDLGHGTGILPIYKYVLMSLFISKKCGR
jgi:hypothetical protein